MIAWSVGVSVASKFWHTCGCGQTMAHGAGPRAQCFFICFSWPQRTANRRAGRPHCGELARAAPAQQLAQLAAPAQQHPPVKLRTGACAHRQRVHRCISRPGQTCVPVHGLARHVPVHKQAVPSPRPFEKTITYYIKNIFLCFTRAHCTKSCIGLLAQNLTCVWSSPLLPPARPLSAAI